MAIESLWRRAAGWLARYGPAELLGTACALLGAAAAQSATGSALAAAVAANWAEALGYYGVIAWRDIAAAGGPSRANLVATLRALLVEFGPAELVSLVAVRNAAIYGAITLAPSLELGVLSGKLVADVVFYLTAIASYELLRARPPAGRAVAAAMRERERL